LPNENAFALQCNPSKADSSKVRPNEGFGCNPACGGEFT
jgi:hypothetical protein